MAIAARKTAEQTLKKNEVLLQQMTNSMKDYAIIMLDADGLVVNWNRGAEKVMGYDNDEIIGKSFSLFYQQTDIDNDEPRRNLAMAKKYGQFETEGERLRKRGHAFWANVVLTALINDAGDFYGYSTITHDISERKNTQEQVEFLSRQISHANDAIFVVDKARRIKSWNLGAEKLYGFTTREVLGEDSNEVLKTNISKEEIDILLKEIAEEDYWTGELKRQTKNGHEIYVHSSSSTIRDAKGDITGYVAVSFDISGQKKLREEVNHLASLVEQSTEAIFSTGLDQCIISWNSGAEKLFGYSKKDAIGKTAAGLGLIQSDPGMLAAGIQELMATGSWRAEINFSTKGGSAFFGSVTANIIKMPLEEIRSVVFLINDISIRKELEERLQKSNDELEQRVKERTQEIYKNEQRFRALIEHSAEGVSLLDEFSNVIYRSPSAYKIIGASPVNNSISYAHPDDLETFKNKFNETLLKPHVPVPYNVRYLNNTTGHYFWTEGTFTNLLDVDGVNAVVANYRDDTQRKEAENKLITSEERLRHTLDNMLEGVQIIGFDWRYIYVNDSMAKHGKYTKEELVGTTVMERYPGIEQTSIYEIYLRCFNERMSFQLENEFIYPDKTIAWFDLSFRPVPEGIFILSVDITDRKKAEENLIRSEKLYRNLFENMLHGFAYCRGEFENGRLTDYIHLGTNKAFEVATGLKDVTWKKLSELMPGMLQSNPLYADMIGRVAMGGTAEKLEIYAEPFKKWLSISLYSPEKEYFVILVDNITERKYAEQKIRKLNMDLEERVIRRTEQLKKTNEELEAFSYSVSHDLRAPLRAIIGFTAILEEDYSSKLDGEAKRITSVIKNNTLKMGYLIDDLLTFSRMGRQDIVKMHINTDDMIKEILERPDIKQHISLHPVSWIIHDLPNINGDINTLRQVWINLVSNAIKYSGKSTCPKIEIGSYHEQDKVVFFIKDNGVGFDEKYKNKLFRVFQRLHTTDEFEGTGIGLAIVEKIISKHNGRVWADAEVNKGASFYFSLPVDT
jgi:PAS domain S-box-containing protein